MSSDGFAERAGGADSGAVCGRASVAPWLRGDVPAGQDDSL